ncbi:hypothetical protein D9615_003189 [Tricholomella constricta]|uniref:Uncharacterized protein n=1 Tax=Tricholomella constricta TaxID=117010 RepID=A0A8H5HJ15_9AGAR|nr:hypothetical protein D9615_003189 [Tricholomella constricta]
MGSLCLSTASILRCASFTRLQVILLIVPTALEVVFSTSLIFTNWGTGRRHLWLTAEGWVYFALALLEMLSHILPAARDGADVFKVLDTVLAATSFLPILLYILFIFLFTRAELVAILPIRLQTMTKLLLLIFIPAIVALNEVASFVGISHGTISINSQSVIAIGFSSAKNETLWTFFTSLTLALLAVYQAINFTFAFYRLIKALLDQRRIETTSSDEAHLFKGIGWITGALKLGAIETVIGFAGGGFGGAITRRVIRMLARACLTIGLVKGTSSLDSSEDFSHIRHELSSATHKEFRRSRLRDFISNPRHSTFRQLTPTATAFHATPRAPHGLSQQLSAQARAESGLAGMTQFADFKRSATAFDMSEKPSRERVTVHFENGTPSLHVRFSALEIPISPFNTTSRSTSLRPATYHADSRRNSSSLLSALVIDDSGKDISNLASPPRAYVPPQKAARAESSYSTRSVPESYTSLFAVRELAPQFPLIPARAGLEPIKQSPATNKSNDKFRDSSASIISRASTAMAKPPPPSPPPPESPGSDSSDIDPFMTEDAPAPAPQRSLVLPTSIPLGQPLRTLRREVPSVPTSALSTPMTVLSGYSYTPTHSGSALTGDTDDDDGGGFLDFASALDTGKSRAFTRDSAGATHPVVGWIDYDAIPKNGHGQSQAGMLAPVMEEGGGGGGGEERKVVRAVSRVQGQGQGQGKVSRIKSIGRVPMRSTPVPVKARHNLRGSLHIERILIPPKEETNVELVQGSLDSVYGRSVLRDSEVLGIEDGSRAREVRERGII